MIDEEGGDKEHGERPFSWPLLQDRYVLTRDAIDEMNETRWRERNLAEISHR